LIRKKYMNANKTHWWKLHLHFRSSVSISIMWLIWHFKKQMETILFFLLFWNANVMENIVYKQVIQWNKFVEGDLQTWSEMIWCDGMEKMVRKLHVRHVLSELHTTSRHKRYFYGARCWTLFKLKIWFHIERLIR